MSLDFTEVLALADAQAANASAAADRAKRAVADAGRDIHAKARAAAPRDTGALAASIRLTAADMSAVVKSGLRYSGFVEFGTSRTPPQPFLNPALDAAIPGFARALAAIAGNTP